VAPHPFLQTNSDPDSIINIFEAKICHSFHKYPGNLTTEKGCAKVFSLFDL
jgi:hypothetical protein